MAYLKIQKKINVNTYGCDVIFIVSDNIYKVEKFLHAKHGGEYPKEDDPAEGYTVTINAGLYVMVIDYRFMSNNLIGHELYHVTHRIARDRDIDDEETMAWLNGYLHESFYDFISSSKFVQFSEKILKKMQDFIDRKEEEKKPIEIKYE